VHASHETLTLHSPIAHPTLTMTHHGSPWLTLLARCECLKRHGVGEREGELGADFSSVYEPSRISLPFRLSQIQQHLFKPRPLSSQPIHAMDAKAKKLYLADSPPTVVRLEIKPHFEALSDQQKRYAHHISR
jgi:hypothetical protein